MIFVGGEQFSSDSLSSQPRGSEILVALMEHPEVVAAVNAFKGIPERKIAVSEGTDSEGEKMCKWVYLFQREYATVDPALVDVVGTDEATTCVGIILRNRKNGMTSVAHMDSPRIVDTGVAQMLWPAIDHNMEAEFDVHLLGGFEDVSLQHVNYNTGARRHAKSEGYSFPLCTKIIDTLWKRAEKFHIKTLCILGHNTRRDSGGNPYPIFHGLLVETSSGLVIPANFDRTSRCPDEIVRRIRLSVCYEDPNWGGKLLETYDTKTDRFVIAPCCWTLRQLHIALKLQSLTDTEILHTCSTSPSAESPDFVDNKKRQWDYMVKHPDWKETFPMKQPRVFERTADGGWRRC